MSKRYKIYDSNTGQIVGDADTAYPEPMTNEGYRIPSHKLGARMFDDVDFPAAMSKAEVGAMAILARHHMIASTNMIGYRQSGQIKAYTAQEIGELAEYSKRQAERFIPKMIKLRVMQRISTNSGPQFYVNPAYFMANGKRLSLDLFLLFRDELTPLLPPEIMQEFLRQARDKAVLKSDATTEAERIVNG